MELPTTKKWWILVPEDQLTEEQVRIGFNRLRSLHLTDILHIQGLKSQRKQLNIKNQELIHENATLRKENISLREELNELKKKPTKEEIKKKIPR